MDLFGDFFPVSDLSVDVRVLEENTTDVLGDFRLREELLGRANENVDVESFSSGADNGERLWKLEFPKLDPTWTHPNDGERSLTTAESTMYVFLPFAAFIDMTIADPTKQALVSRREENTIRSETNLPSAAAVPSSNKLALANSKPVREVTIVW